MKDYEGTVLKVISEWNPLGLSNPETDYFDVISDILDSTKPTSSANTISKTIRKSFLVSYGKGIPVSECKRIAEQIISNL